jgi:predicted metal-binding membrane protein
VIVVAPRPVIAPGLAGVAAALFVASATATIVWCRSMSAMDMSMPGGWTMSMAWMRTPDQTWAGAAGVFVAMWVVMMVAMMLPALLPVLRRYADAAAADGVPVGRAVALAGAAYFVVWAAAGVAVFPIGASLSALAMARPAVASAVPLAIGAALLAAGALQFTPFKARALACCAMPAGRGGAATDGWSPWQHGLRLGVRCLRCCGNLMAILPVLGVMDPGVMAAVTLAITAERIAPAGARVARVVGAGLVLAGVVQLARAIAIA